MYGIAVITTQNVIDIKNNDAAPVLSGAVAVLKGIKVSSMAI